MTNIFNTSSDGISRSAVIGFSWNLFGSLARVLAGLIINILLARLLGPEPFGLVALSILVIGIGNLLIESGLGVALIQKKEITPNDVAFVFTMQMALGVLLACIVGVSAPLLSIVFANPELTPVLRAMSLVLVLQASAQVSIALLRRVFDFKRIQQIQIGSYLIGYLCLGVPLALARFGVWSLVLAQITQSVFNTVLLYLVVRHPLHMTRFGDVNLKSFGLRILGGNIANYIIQNVDNLIVGLTFGATNLGLYSRAFYLGMTPIGVIVTPAQIVLLPTISRIEKRSQRAQVFIALYTAFTVLLFPPYFLLALGAGDLIQIIFGPKWHMSAPLLVPLALAMPLFALMAIQGPILSGMGKPEYEMHAQWKSAFIAVCILFGASRISLELTAWSILLIYGIRLWLLTRSIVTILEMRWSQVIRPILIGISVAGLTGASWLLFVWLLPNTWFLWLRVGIQSSFAIICWVIILLLGRKLFFENGFEVYRSLLNKQTADQPI